MSSGLTININNTEYKLLMNRNVIKEVEKKFKKDIMTLAQELCENKKLQEHETEELILLCIKEAKNHNIPVDSDLRKTLAEMKERAVVDMLSNLFFEAIPLSV